MKIRVVLLLIIAITLVGCGKDKGKIDDISNLINGQANSPGQIGTLDDILSEGENEDTLDNIVTEDKDIETVPSDIVVVEKRNDTDKQETEINNLINYTVKLNSKANIQIDEKESDSGVKEIASQTGSINLTVISIGNIVGDIPTLEIKTDEKIYQEQIRTKNGIRYTIYTSGDLDINDIELRLYNNESKSQYRVLNIKDNLAEIKDENGEVVYGDIIKIDDNLFTLLGVKELKSNWIEGNNGEKSVASRTYRLELQNVEKGPQRVLTDDSINNLKAVDNTGKVYEVNTDILSNGGIGSVKFSIGHSDTNNVITKYTIDNKEYIDITIEVAMDSNGKTPREEIVKADTIIRETASKMFISYDSEINYWITAGYRN